jgi:hypothetical protein
MLNREAENQDHLEASRTGRPSLGGVEPKNDQRRPEALLYRSKLGQGFKNLDPCRCTTVSNIGSAALRRAVPDTLLRRAAPGQRNLAAAAGTGRARNAGGWSR